MAEESVENPVSTEQTNDEATKETAEDEVSANINFDVEARKLSARELLELRRAFSTIDADNSGVIDISEIEIILQDLGHEITKQSHKDVLAQLDKNGDGLISFEEFKNWWSLDMTDETNAALKGGGSLRNFWIAPAMMVFHLFDHPDFFRDLGPGGIPFWVAGEIITWIINVLIIVSTLAFVFETEPQYSMDANKNPEEFQEWEDTWMIVEVICVAAFTIDFCVRGIASAIIGDGDKFVKDLMNWVDVIAIAPFFVALVFDDFPDLRFVRVIRLARVLRSAPEKYSSMGGVIADIVTSAALGLLLPLYFMFLSMFVWASVVYYAEAPYTLTCYVNGEAINEKWTPARLDESGAVTIGNEGCLTEYGCRCGCDADAHQFASVHGFYLLSGEMKMEDSETPSLSAYSHQGQGSCDGTIAYITWDGSEHSSDMFDDGRPGGIGTAMWWCVVTFTTVGYGDMMPRTPQGQIFGVLTMTSGIFFLAMPLAVVGASFSAAWAKAEAAHISRLEEREAKRIMEMSDEERAKLPTHAVPKPLSTVVEEMPLEVITRLDILSYVRRMRILANSVVQQCPESALPEVRASIDDFNASLQIVRNQLDKKKSWRPKQLIAAENGAVSWVE